MRADSPGLCPTSPPVRISAYAGTVGGLPARVPPSGGSGAGRDARGPRKRGTRTGRSRCLVSPCQSSRIVLHANALHPGRSRPFPLALGQRPAQALCHGNRQPGRHQRRLASLRRGLAHGPAPDRPQPSHRKEPTTNQQPNPPVTPFSPRMVSLTEDWAHFVRLRRRQEAVTVIPSSPLKNGHFCCVCGSPA
jgi:hypothetical protein